MEKMGDGIKKRIIQAGILLLFILGMAAGSFYMVKMEAETAEGMDAGQIKMDRLIQELIVSDIWKSAFRDKKVLISEDEMQTLYYALEVSRDEKVVLSEDYAEAYYGFLREYYRNNPDSEFRPIGFRLVYIDGDDIPELLLMEDKYHAAGVLVYTYYDGRMVEVGEFGSIGTMQYIEKKGMIFSGFYNMGEGWSGYYELGQGVLECVCALHFVDGDAFSEPIESYYEIDDVPVSEEVYEAKRQELESDEYISIGYDDAVFFTETNLRALLAEEIERLEKEKDWERQQAEAIEAYGDFSGEHGGEWKNFLKDKVLSVSECSEDEILRFEYDDFNGDGNYEAFVFLGKEYEAYDEIEYAGSFWFVSAKQCIRLDDGMSGYRSIEGSMTWGGNQKYVYCITGEVFTANISRVWTVKNGKAVESRISGVGEVRYDGKEYLEIVRDAYDGVYDQYSDIMNGHTYKPYFYKYNRTINDFEECTSEEIDEEELKRLCGFDLGGEIKAEGYEILSILKLENDIVVVNYAIHDEGEFPCINYENVMWDCTTGDYWKQGVTSWKDAGFHGTY